MTAPAKKPPLERALFALITRGWDAGKVSGYAATLRQRDKVMPAEILHTFASIDAKATGLLTHTSMMIAGLGLLAPLVANNQIEMAIVLAEIGIYMLIALGCLRCLSVFRTHEFVDAGDRAADIVHHELIIRSELYSLCIRAAIIFSIVVFLLLPILYFWAPGK